jgi:hypothetical protein
MTYTPGPWKIDSRHGLTVGPARVRIGTKGTNTAKDWEQHHANARLIATAPDMLAALYKIAYGDESVPDYYREIAHATIAKAEGK